MTISPKQKSIKYIIKSLSPKQNISSSRMLGYQSYISAIKSALNAGLCLRDFPSTLFQNGNQPYIQLTGYNPKIDEYLIMKPIYLSRKKQEVFLIESSINSCRISFTIKKSDQIEKLIVGTFSGMTAARAELLELLRRKPLPGFDVTLLITSDILEKYNKEAIIELIEKLLLELEKDFMEIKLNINTQARVGATFFVDTLANPIDDQLF